MPNFLPSFHLDAELGPEQARARSVHRHNWSQNSLPGGTGSRTPGLGPEGRTEVDSPHTTLLTHSTQVREGGRVVGVVVVVVVVTGDSCGKVWVVLGDFLVGWGKNGGAGCCSEVVLYMNSN